MARIPQQIARRGLEVVQAPKYPVLDATARAVQGFGGTVEAVAQTWKERQDQVDRFNSLQGLNRLGSGLSGAATEALATAPPDGAGYLAGMQQREQEAFDSFIQTVPAHLRPEFEQRLETLRAENANTWASVEAAQTRDYQRGVLVERTDNARVGILEGGPDRLEAYQAETEEFINSSTLPPAEKRELIAASRRALQQAAAREVLARQQAASGGMVSTLPPATQQFFAARGEGLQVQGVNPTFAGRLQRALAAAEAATGTTARVNSMSRSSGTQAQLYANYTQRPVTWEGVTYQPGARGGLAAPPGRSRHERGQAADIQRGPVLEWLHAHAGEYGLEFLKDEAFRRDPVHIQMAGGAGGGLPAVPPGVRPMIASAASAAGVNEGLFASVIGAESSFNPNAVSPSGAIGYGQLLPSTARDLGVDPNDPQQNLNGSARYLKQMLDKYGGDERLALMAYNWGPGNVDDWLAAGADVGDVPQETINYLNKVQGGVGGGGAGGDPFAGDPRFADLTYEDRLGLLEEAERQRQVNARQYGDGLADETAWIRAGNDPTGRYNGETAASVLGNPEAAAAVQREVDQAIEYAAAARAIQFASPAELALIAADATSALSSPDNFVDSARQAADILGLIADRQDAVEADPARYVMQDPGVSASYNAMIQAQRPGGGDAAAIRAATGAYSASSLSLQDQMGIPQSEQRLLPDAAVAAIAETVKVGTGQNVAQTMRSLAAQWGSQWPRVFEELSEDLPAVALVVGNMDQPDQMLAAERLAEAAKVGREAYQDTLPADKVTRIREALPVQLEDFAGTLAATPQGGGRTMTAVSEAVRLLALSYARDDGDSGDRAVERAVEDIIGKKYQINGTFRVPMDFDVDDVSRGAAVAQSIATGTNWDVPISLIGLTEEEARASYVETIKAEGYWVTSPDETGLSLYEPTTRSPVTINGEPMVIPFAELETYRRARFAPSAAGVLNQMGVTTVPNFGQPLPGPDPMRSQVDLFAPPAVAPPPAGQVAPTSTRGLGPEAVPAVEPEPGARSASLPLNRLRAAGQQASGPASANPVAADALPPAAPAATTPAAALALPPAAVVAMPAAAAQALAAVSPAAAKRVEAVSAGRALTPTTAAQVTPRTAAALTPDALAAVSPQAAAAFRAETVAALTPPAMAAMSPAALGALGPGAVAAMTPQQAAALTSEAMAAISPSAATALKPDAFGAITPEAMAALTPAVAAQVTPQQAAAVTPRQAAQVTPAQAAALTPEAVAAMKPAAVSALTPAATAALRAASPASPAATGAVDARPAAVVEARPAPAATTAPTEAVPARPAMRAAPAVAMTPVEAAALQPAAAAAMQPAAVMAMSPAAVAAMRPAAMAALPADTADAIAAVSPAAARRVQAVSQGRALSPTMAARVTPSAAEALTPDALAAVLPQAAAALKPEAVAALKPDALGAMSPAAVGALTPASVGAMTARQAAALTPEAAAAITPEGLAAMRPAAREALPELPDKPDLPEEAPAAAAPPAERPSVRLGTPNDAAPARPAVASTPGAAAARPWDTPIAGQNPMANQNAPALEGNPAAGVWGRTAPPRLQDLPARTVAAIEASVKGSNMSAAAAVPEIAYLARQLYGNRAWTGAEPPALETLPPEMREWVWNQLARRAGDDRRFAIQLRGREETERFLRGEVRLIWERWKRYREAGVFDGAGSR